MPNFSTQMNTGGFDRSTMKSHDYKSAALTIVLFAPPRFVWRAERREHDVWIERRSGGHASGMFWLKDISAQNVYDDSSKSAQT